MPELITIQPGPAAPFPKARLRELEQELRARLQGEVRFDSTSRLLYATDASIYQVIPLGVIFPRHEADVVETVRLAAQYGVPLLPRGSGTSLAGQTVGAALVLDFTRYMNAVVELNAAERWVRVQPGVVLDELNAYLKPHGLKFAPDVATSNRASIGGMMGNNSCGSHSILYGRTVDHVLEQRVVLSDGSTALFQQVDAAEWHRRARPDTLEGRIYGEIDRICTQYAAEVDARFPRIMRRVGGYNLDEMVRWGRFNLAGLMVGSEGTLATVTEAKLNLVPTPKHAGLLVSHFHDLIASLEAAETITTLAPAAVELVDRIILDLTRDNLDLAPARAFLQGDPEAILVSEFYGDTREEMLARLENLAAALEARGMGYAHVRLPEAATQKNVWSVRNAGLGLLMGMKGDAKPVGFIEDTAVAPARLPEYIRDLRALLSGYGLDACYYAHASVGCIHVRPILNLKLASDRERMHEIGRRVAELVLHYGGAMSAEHGDGLARSEWQERMFGPELYQAFRDVKAAFDPQGIMNPGKIVEAPPMHQNLRLHSQYHTHSVETVLDFSRDGGFAGAVEMCSGVGACRKKVEGGMCPSYRATLDEMHTTRARANILRMVLSGQADLEAGASAETLADPRVLEVMDLCLGCKACKSECPSNVDMAKLKYEFLHLYHQRHGVPARAKFFGHVAQANRWGSLVAPLANRVQELPLVRGWMESRFGVDRRRTLPTFAGQTFHGWWKQHQPEPGAGRRGEVALLVDTFTNYNEPEIGHAAVRVLEALGYRVRVPRLECCGRPQLSKGLLPEARELARRNVAALHDLTAQGVPLVGLEPSCVVAYKDEYREFGLGEDAEKVSGNTWMVEDFLASRHGGDPDLPFSNPGRPLHFHGHCHQKAVLGTRGTVQALKLLPGAAITEIASGCCGMAGSFGYETEHYDVSLKMGELALFPHVRSLPEDALLLAPGTSCRHQLRDGTGRRALHPVQALALSLGPLTR